MLVDGRVATLPQPSDRPVLIFDEDCGFCRWWAARVRWLDRGDVVRLVSLWDPLAEPLSGQPRERLRQAVHYVGRDGAVFAGAAAVREVSRHLRGGAVVRVPMTVPGGMWVAERLYAWIARTWGPVG